MTYKEAADVIRSNYEITEALGIALDALKLHEPVKPLNITQGQTLNPIFHPEFGRVIEQVQTLVGNCPSCKNQVNKLANESICMVCSQVLDWGK